jgi:formate dehydrogenase major subunit
VNVLTGDTLDPVAKIPEYKHSAVRVSVEPADESAERADESGAATGTD